VYLYTDVLNYDTVIYAPNLLVYCIHTQLVLNNYFCMLEFWMVFGAFTFHSVF